MAHQVWQKLKKNAFLFRQS